jgi:hypothetical protein
MRKLKYIKEFLNYDELDLDLFSNRYIVGRWFYSEEDALEYLKSVIKNSNNKNISDFIIWKDEKDKSSKPYRILPKPSDMELRRAKASEFIKKHAILSSGLKYVTYPLYAFVDYKHIDRIKQLGVSYSFKPISEINLNSVLSRHLRERGYFNSIGDDNILKLYGRQKMSESEVKTLYQSVENLLDNFNYLIGTDYYIQKEIKKETDSSIAKQLINKLDSENYNPNLEFNKEYKSVDFLLKRGKDEEEFLAVISMESPEKPKML